MNQAQRAEVIGHDVSFAAASGVLNGILAIPQGAAGVVVFAHGSGSSRLSPRNQAVARALHSEGLGTLLFDLLTEDEAAIDNATSRYRFNINLLAERLVGAATGCTAQAKPARCLSDSLAQVRAPRRR